MQQRLLRKLKAEEQSCLWLKEADRSCLGRRQAREEVGVQEQQQR